MHVCARNKATPRLLCLVALMPMTAGAEMKSLDDSSFDEVMNDLTGMKDMFQTMRTFLQSTGNEGIRKG